MFMICPVISNKNLGGVYKVEIYLHKTSQEKNKLLMYLHVSGKSKLLM